MTAKGNTNVSRTRLSFDEAVREFMVANDCDQDEAERRVAAARQRGKVVMVDGQPVTFGTK